MMPADQIRVCYKCDYETNQASNICPQCGQPQLRTPSQIRMLGWLLAVLGAGLAVFMTGLSLVVGKIILFPNLPGTTTRFTGGPEMVLFIVGIFGVVLVFGIASFLAGVYQIRTGRRNKHLTKTILVLGAVFMFVGIVVRMFV